MWLIGAVVCVVAAALRCSLPLHRVAGKTTAEKYISLQLVCLFLVTRKQVSKPKGINCRAVGLTVPYLARPVMAGPGPLDMTSLVLRMQVPVRVDGDLKSRRLTSFDDDVSRRDSASDDTQLRHSRRHGCHDDDDARSASCTRQERVRLGLRDKLDQLRLRDASSDVTVTSRRKEVETGSTSTVAADDMDEKPVCALGDVQVTAKSKSSSSTSCWFSDDRCRPSGICSFHISCYEVARPSVTLPVVHQLSSGPC